MSFEQIMFTNICKTADFKKLLCSLISFYIICRLFTNIFKWCRLQNISFRLRFTRKPIICFFSGRIALVLGKRVKFENFSRMTIRFFKFYKF